MSMFRNLLMAKSGGGVELSAEAVAYCRQYGVLNDVVAYCQEDMDIVPFINDWPNLIHSLVDTGFENYVTTKNYQGLNIGLIIDFNSQNQYTNDIVSEARYIMSKGNNSAYVFSPGWVGNQFSLRKYDNVSTGNMIFTYGAFVHHVLGGLFDEICTFKFERGVINLLNKNGEVVVGSSIPNSMVGGYDKTYIGLLGRSSSTDSYVSISYVKFRSEIEDIYLVPYHYTEHYCMLDIHKHRIEDAYENYTYPIYELKQK